MALHIADGRRYQVCCGNSSQKWPTSGRQDGRGKWVAALLVASCGHECNCDGKHACEKHANNSGEAYHIGLNNASSKNTTVVVEARDTPLTCVAMMALSRTLLGPPNEAANTICPVISQRSYVLQPVKGLVLDQASCNLFRYRIAYTGRTSDLSSSSEQNEGCAPKSNRCPSPDQSDYDCTEVLVRSIPSC